MSVALPVGMLLKRKTYFIAIGIVLSQLSIAEYWNSRSPKSFGDCATCTASVGVPFPLGNSNAKLADVVSNINLKLGKVPTAFQSGNGINGAMVNLPALASQVNQQAANMPAPTPMPPLVPPQFWMPTQERIDALFPSYGYVYAPPAYYSPPVPQIWSM